MYSWFQVKNKANNVGEIFMYGEICQEKWCDEDTTPTVIKDQIHSLKGTKSVNLYVNSGGGGVFAGMAILNMLSRLPQKITSYIDGTAASIAGVIVAGVSDDIHIYDGSSFMLHNPSGIAMGDAEEMRQTADLLEKVKASIVEIFRKATGLSAKKIGKLMDAETWMFGKAAVDMGFADVLDSKQVVTNMVGNSAIINGINIDISKFKNFPREEIAIRNRQKKSVLKMREKFNVLKNYNKGAKQ